MWPISLGIYALQYDAIDVYLPWRFYGSESLRQGMVPLWNPFQDGGYPFYADHQYSIWNPELFLVSLFTRFNVSTLHWLFLFYLAIGGLGFRFLLKQLKLDKSVWFIGGVLFMLSGIVVGHGQSMISILGAVWLPWALGSYIKALNSDFNRKDIVGLILFMFLMLAAGYQAVSIMLFYVVVAIGGYYLIDFIRKKEMERLKRFVIGHLWTFAGLALLLAGIVVSLSEVFPHLSRLSGLTLEESQLIHFHPKSLGSSIFPLASVQEEYQGTSRSAQNIFSGVLSFFFILYAIRGLKKRLTPTVIILLIFGFIYGLAALGPYTPVQPFFYKFVPGCDQFYYASFFRYFTWIALLILVCFGIQNYLQEGKQKHLMIFVAISVVFYGVSAIISSDSWEIVSEAFNGSWAYTFRRMGWSAGILLQSIGHAVLLLVFLLILLKRQSRSVVLLFVVLELGIISQFNMPVTVHGEYKVATLDNQLSTKKEGFFIPNNGVTMGHNLQQGIYASIWRNQGNFTNLPTLESYSSFHLAGRDDVHIENAPLNEELGNNSMVYLTGVSGSENIRKFSPNRIEIEVLNAHSGDTLIYQQGSFPGWITQVNGEAAKIVDVNVFEQGVVLNEGRSVVEFMYENDRIQWLYYLSTFGFIAILLIYFVQQSRVGSVRNRFILVGVVFVLVIARYLSFGPTPSEGFKLVSGEKIVEFNSNLVTEDYQEVYRFANENQGEITLTDCNMDIDPKLLSILSFFNDEQIEQDGSFIFSRGKYDIDTTQHVIPSKGYFDIDLNSYGLTDLKGQLLFGMNVHESVGVQDFYVVIETKIEDRILFATTIPMHELLYSEESTSFADGYLLPVLEDGRSFKMYLWNNSSKTFTFSNFRAKIIQ